MPEIDPEKWGARDVVFPRIYQCGNFRPSHCSLCGHPLGGYRFIYAEGTLCADCDLPIHCAAARAAAAVTHLAGES
jgi:hypothetical protein